MAKKTIKTVGEGGAHAHRISLNKIQTEKDGIHKHIFFVNDRLLMTDLSGSHFHPLNTSSNEVKGEDVRHSHTVTIRTEQGPVQIQVTEGEGHTHEIQSELTTLSGVHRHTLEAMGQRFVSLVPSDILQEINDASKSIKGFENFKIEKSEDPMETDFALIKKLNQTQFKEILQKAVESSIIKRMSSLGSGLRIESLILSKERFGDVGIATRFVLDQGLDVKSSLVLNDQGLFTFQVMSREAFEETTLQRIRITEGVEAVVGFLAAKEQSAGMTAETVASSATGDSLTDVQQEVEPTDNLLSNRTGVTMVADLKGKEMKSLKDKFQKTFSKFDDDEVDEPTETKKSFQTSFEIISKNDEKRLIMGPVLIPDNVDLQDDIISSNEIEKAAHGYMIKLAYRDDKEFLKSLGFRNVDKAGGRGFQHIDFSRKMAVVETFIAPVDMTINGRMIVKGTWVMTMKVFDDEVWNLVKLGKITGFSIGGHSKSRPANIKA